MLDSGRKAGLGVWENCLLRVGKIPMIFNKLSSIWLPIPTFAPVRKDITFKTYTMATTSDISRGMILKLDGSLYSVVEFGENKTARAEARAVGVQQAGGFSGAGAARGSCRTRLVQHAASAEHDQCAPSGRWSGQSRTSR